MNCPKCSAPSTNNAAFCEACGAPLNQTERIDPLIGRTLLNQYIVRAKLGEGGFGAVYEAEQPSMGRKVAVKTLHRHLTSNRQIVARFHREAMAASRLEHPYSLKMYNSGETDDGLLWIAMEFLHGQTLDARIKKGVIPIQELLLILEPVCEVLEEAHQKGIIHRDLKPENIFLTQSANGKLVPKLLDFGISGLLGDENLVTETIVVSGTPAYMSPEQWRGLKGTDARSDIYSLGMVVYRCLSARLPFQADSTPQWMQKHCLEEAPALITVAKGAVSARLNDAVMKAIEKDPAKRYQSSLSFYQGLKDATLEAPSGAKPMASAELKPIASTEAKPVVSAIQEAPTSPVSSAPPKNKAQTPLIVAAAGAALLVGAWAVWPKQELTLPTPARMSQPVTTLASSSSPAVLPEVLAPAQIKRERSLFLQEQSGVEPEFRLDPGDAPYQGRVDAKLTVIVFGDFAGFYFAPFQETIQRAQERYGDELRFVWRDLPEDSSSTGFSASLAARAARLQGDDKFWAMFEVFRQERKLLMGKAEVDFGALAAKVSGLDVERWRADLSSPSLYEQLQREIAQTKKLGIVDGTPKTFINGEIFHGGQSFSVLAPVLARQYKRAEAQLSLGIDRKDLYADLVQDGYTSLADLKARIPGPDDTTVDARLPRAPLTKPGNVTFQQLLIRFGGADEPYSLISRAEARRRAQLLVDLARTRGIDFSRLQLFYNDSLQPLIENAFPGMLVAPLEDAAFAMDNGQVSDVIESEFGLHVIMRVSSTGLQKSLVP